MTTQANDLGRRPADWIAHHARATPLAPACLDVHSGRSLSYLEFHRRIDSLSAYLQSTLGLPPMARVLVLSRNDTDIFEIQFACQRSATLFVPLNWRLAPGELVAIAKDCAADVLFHSAEFESAARAVSGEVRLSATVRMDAGRPSEYEEAIAASAAPRQHKGEGPLLDDPWGLIYTSGTTGRPKGACVSYRMALVNAVGLGSAFQVTSASRNLAVMPMFHTGGLNVFANPVFFHGGMNIVLREFDAGQIIGMARDAHLRPTHLLAVPTMHASLQAQKDFDLLARSSLAHLAVAGAPCPVRLIESYVAIGLDLRQCWGMTEAGPLVLTSPPAMPASRRGSSGLPGMFADVCIADGGGEPVGQGAIGELLVKGPAVTRGYWKRPEADAAAFTADGWFRTGDAARVDDEGFFYIVDRWKDMFISGGENVYPAEVEAVLARHPAVRESAVVGIGHEHWGEVGRAYVVLHAGTAATAATLQAHCAQSLARYKVPKEVVFVEALPHGPSGKVLKKQLRDLA